MSEFTLSEKQKDLLEQLGVFLESRGWQPAVGRILGLLIISESEELTFDDVRETLHLSKSATSTALNLLLNTGKVEYFTKPGDRKRYFKVKKIVLKDMAYEEHKKRCTFTNLLKEVYAQKKNKESAICQSFKEALDYFEFMNNEFFKLFKKWESTKKS
ncbi:MAG: hypothetical protein CMO01_24170 [Thalassobius sp.]|nr:hypothetical protein [Thalassovita sp.]